MGTWSIAVAALVACAPQADGPTPVHHPGYASPAQHGFDTRVQAAPPGDCRSCHGDDLDGGTDRNETPAPGCDACHTEVGRADWRTDCAFCHGGEAGDTLGAPPRDLDGETEPTAVSFQAHQAHVAPGDHPVWGCEVCHAVVADVLDPGHAFDDTPGVSEVDFDRGHGARWDGATCSASGCHGDGTTPGSIEDGLDSLTCDGCHGMGAEQLSPVHDDHVSDPAIACADCHPTVDAAGAVTDPARHVDGELDVAFSTPDITAPTGVTSCTGGCHGAPHHDGELGHAPGHEAPERHGLEHNLQVYDCTSCHGTDLRGEGDAPGCDDCHIEAGVPNWRTYCNFCHGGELDDHGAPPQDIDGETDPARISFVAHFAHVRNQTGRACDKCHPFRTQVLYPGHTRDDTPGVAEVDFSASVAPTTQWNNGTCSDSYCHSDGLGLGQAIDDSLTPLPCDGCHADTSSSARWASMSGEHDRHLQAGATCVDCHAGVVDGAQAILDHSLHVDGEPTVILDDSTDIRRGGGTCTGTCHGAGHEHVGDAW